MRIALSIFAAILLLSIGSSCKVQRHGQRSVVNDTIVHNFYDTTHIIVTSIITDSITYEHHKKNSETKTTTETYDPQTGNLKQRTTTEEREQEELDKYTEVATLRQEVDSLRILVDRLLDSHNKEESEEQTKTSSTPWVSITDIILLVILMVFLLFKWRHG